MVRSVVSCSTGGPGRVIRYAAVKRIRRVIEIVRRIVEWSWKKVIIFWVVICIYFMF